MKQRRIVTTVSSGIALGIALFYVFATPGDGPGAAREPAVPAVNLPETRPSLAATAPQTQGESAGMANTPDADDNESDPTLGSKPASERSFGEVVRFVVRERCDEAGVCRPAPVALHAYEDYSIDELKVIAKFDGEAAIVLANKFGGEDFKAAREWALRAFVMTRDPYAYHMAANFSGVSRGEGLDANGNLDRTMAERAYVWLKTGYLLGVNDGTDLAQQEMILDRHGYEDRARLDKQVNAGVAYLTRKRLELTGEGF